MRTKGLLTALAICLTLGLTACDANDLQEHLKATFSSQSRGEGQQNSQTAGQNQGSEEKKPQKQETPQDGKKETKEEKPKAEETKPQQETPAPETDEPGDGQSDEQKLREMMEQAAGLKMANTAYVDMDHDGHKELVGVCCEGFETDQYQIWYCSSDGSTCRCIYQDEIWMEYGNLELLEYENETHVAINVFRSMGTVKFYSILSLKDGGIHWEKTGGQGYVSMPEPGTVTLCVEDYDGMYDAEMEMLMGHSWKNTYLIYDNGQYKECGATVISEGAFLEYDKASQCKKEIEEANSSSDIDHLAFTYFRRPNGILHIQCDKYYTNGDIWYGYYTVKYSGKTLTDTKGEHTEGQMHEYFSDLEVIY